MKEGKVTIRGVELDLYEKARILSIRLKVSMGQIINEALRLRLEKEKKGNKI